MSYRVTSFLIVTLALLTPLRADDESPVPEKSESSALTVEQVAERSKSSVVVISSLDENGRQVGLGSGFLVSTDGLIATNWHVIALRRRPLSVQFADGSNHKVIAVHATERLADLAIIQIEGKDFPALSLADSDDLEQGQSVVAIGHPRQLRYSVVSGVLSGRREIEGRPMLQLAIPIEPGNSGGPLLDLHGEVQGLLTLKSLVTRNLGYAVPINALKPLLENPNPVSMDRWLKIGALDSKKWTTLYGAHWSERSGRIRVEGEGAGIGRRSLSLSLLDVPQPPFEVAVDVRLQDESGAAGLVFHSDGAEKHYGFYPSAGNLRLTRFDGADVFSWQVLTQFASSKYKQGDWNTLKVRVEKDKFTCLVNDEVVIESNDAVYTEGQVGLAKFRDTVAEFKRFRLAKEIPSDRPPTEVVEQIAGRVSKIEIDRPPSRSLVEQIAAEYDSADRVLQEQAEQLELQAKRMRELAEEVQQHRIRKQLVAELSKKENEINLLRAALLVSRLDDDDLDVAVYERSVERMIEELKSNLPDDATPEDRLQALDAYLFDELGFHGARGDYYTEANSYLNQVIDERAGLPITLSVLYIEIARRLDLKVVGVGLPGHFVVRYEPKEGDGQLIDPFNRGARMTRDDAAEKVKSITGRPFDEQFLETQSKRAIIVRMLRNLLGLATNKQDTSRMLRYVEAIIDLEPESASDRWMRAVLRYQSKRLSEARDDVDWLVENQPDSVDPMQVRQLERALDDALHEQQ